MATSTAKAQEDRLRRSLSLGLRAPTPSYPGRHKIWWNSDAEVQRQALRAIQAFLNVHKSWMQSTEKALLDDVISSLEGLLKVVPEQLQALAADVAVALLNVSGASLLGSRIRGLCFSLVQLFSRSKSCNTCAIALHIIINDASKLKTYIDEDLWNILKEGNILNILVGRLQAQQIFDGEGVFLYVSHADLCTAILRWRPATRFSLGSNLSFYKSSLRQARNSNEAVCCAALRLCAALALCGGVVSLQVQDSQELCNCLIASTDISKSNDVRIEAFQFLYILTRSTNLGTSVGETSIDLVCANICKAMMEQQGLSSARWPLKAEKLLLEASQAAQGLLHFPGRHHHSAWRAGLFGAMASLLLDFYDSGVVSYPKSAKYDQVFGPILWDALSWLSINAPTGGDESHLKTKQQEGPVLNLIDFACRVLLKVVDRRGLRSESTQPQDQGYAGFEGVTICKTMLFLLFSPSRHLASSARQGLERGLEQHGYDWLPSSVNRLSLLLSTGAASESMIALMILMAFCCLSLSAHCRQQLVENGVLDILIGTIKSRVLVSDKHQTTTAATSYFCKPYDRSICCSDEQNTWEGKDLLLFFSLWAFASLARGSPIAKAMQSSLTKRLPKHGEWDTVPERELDNCFWVLASSPDNAMGVRWWASCCLACCGLYGFPSEKSQIWRLFNDSGSADIKLHLANGGHLYAHKVIIATKCPALLPPPMLTVLTSRQSTASEVSCPTEIKLSARIHEASLKSLLEFVYKGCVFIEDFLISEVKVLAKRCGLVTLLHLLQGKAPLWGSVPDTMSFTLALGNMGCSFADIFFEDKDSSQVGCTAAEGDGRHQHAHRVILSSHCSYFEGLFRSGMQDSSFRVMKLPLQLEALEKLLQYLYSMVLPRKQFPEAGCMFSLSCRSDQVKYLNFYVELAQLAELWLLEDLKEQCLRIILYHLESNMHLGPDVIKFASSSQQWWLVEQLAKCVARDYPGMRESGKLDNLHWAQALS
ncbi:hypothetical protein GOP47_0008102 [Adiantum capillus-veneris]|uniref:BTB domain-containing protein n=1 Tax=Adiantum capillus-veneris TaxID=13818 RepID=A0A9D4UYE2_ADICA|nr:hypothetical protein GOP47_0008102 [Adiantum capillus-veneris]